MCGSLYIFRSVSKSTTKPEASSSASCRNSTLFQVFRSSQLCCALFMQFSLDCYIAQDVVVEVCHLRHDCERLNWVFQSLNVGDAAYNSDWYSSPILASYVKMVIVRSLKPATLTAGGIVVVDKQTMTSVSCKWLQLIRNCMGAFQVLKTTFSYLTALKTVE